jgi:hypothetical protein
MASLIENKKTVNETKGSLAISLKQPALESD